MGLLDGLLGSSFDDPKTAATLQAAQGLLSGRGVMQGLNSGLLGYSGSLQKSKEQDLSQRFKQAQIDDFKAQEAERQQQARSSMAKQAQQAELQQYLRSLSSLQGNVVPALSQGAQQGSVGPTIANADRMNQMPAPRLDPQRMIALGMRPDDAKAYAESPDWGRPKVARTIDTVDAQGRPIVRQFDDYGRPIGTDQGQWKAPIQVDQGDRRTFVDPSTMRPLGAFGINQSPDSRASNAVGWANNRLGQQRLTMEQQNQAKGQYDPARGLMIDPRSGQATPVMQNGQPIGAPGNKPSEGYFKQMSGVANVQSAIDDYRKNLQAMSPTDALTPSGRAKIGTYYNNVMLQAKEAYNLGVLSGPDYEVLTSIVADPNSWKGFTAGRQSLDSQAKNLDQLMGKIGANVAQVHGQQVPTNVRVPTPGPRPGVVEDGHRFRGGNPADPSNWEKL